MFPDLAQDRSEALRMPVCCDRSSTTHRPRRNSLIPLLLFCSFLSALAGNDTARASQTVINTYVGGGDGDGAAAINATLDPRGLALVGNAGTFDIYVADGLNNRVRRVDGTTGLIETIAGNGDAGYGGDGGQGQDASLWLPLDVAVDGARNVYIADS